MSAENTTENECRHCKPWRETSTVLIIDTFQFDVLVVAMVMMLDIIGWAYSANANRNYL